MTDCTRAPAARRRHGYRTLLLGLALLAVGTLAFPLGGWIYVSLSEPALAAAAQATEETNPRANFWRAVRDSEPGYTSSSGAYTTNVLIQNGGEIWRQLRNGPVATIGAWVLAAPLILIALFHLTIGPHRLERTPSGDRVPRWSLGERVLHWYTAVLFVVLAVTGLSLLFGRAALIPIIGLEAFAAYAGVAKQLHNYLGPFFLAGVLVEILVWARYNLFKREDLHWLRHLGGMLSGHHTHAGRTNGGEKVWFWFIATAGLVGVGVSGLIMDFPNFEQSRQTMQIANVVHTSLGILWTAIAFGHIYLGTLGTPGSLDGMTKGHVSKEWMQEHHDRWYEQLTREGEVPRTAASSRTEPSLGRQPSG